MYPPTPRVGGGKFIQMYNFPKGFQGFRRPPNFMSIPPSRQNAILPRVLKLFDSFGPELGGGKFIQIYSFPKGFQGFGRRF